MRELQGSPAANRAAAASTGSIDRVIPLRGLNLSLLDRKRVIRAAVTLPRIQIEMCASTGPVHVDPAEREWNTFLAYLRRLRRPQEISSLARSHDDSVPVRLDQ